MKKLLFVVSVILIFASCKKEEFGQYNQVLEPVDNLPTTTYVYGGTLPSTGTVSNDLVGTTWVLTKYVSAFATEYPYDTIAFVSNNEYTINGGAVRTYQLNSLPLSNNFDLSLYFFFPMGGSHYSGEVGETFVGDGEINNVQFQDLQNEGNTILTWFTKI
jgi:hypothetical protein